MSERLSKHEGGIKCIQLIVNFKISSMGTVHTKMKMIDTPSVLGSN